MINSGVVHGMRFVSQGERIVMLVEPGCVENQEEMENDFPAASAIYFKKRMRKIPSICFYAARFWNWCGNTIMRAQ